VSAFHPPNLREANTVSCGDKFRDSSLLWGLAKKPEIKAWQESGRWVVLAIGSGKYQFECETGGE
jgi:hypothetical protein